MLFNFAVNEFEAQTVSGEHLLFVKKLLELDTSEKGPCLLDRKGRQIATQDISWLCASPLSRNSEGLLTT